jgi:thioredoxin reductase (NADPH)
MEEAHFLSRFATPLYLVTSGSGIKPSSDQRQELLSHPNVEVVPDARPLEVLGDDQGVTGLKLERRKEGAVFELGVDGVFIFSGKKRPGTDFLQGAVELDPEGFARVDENCETSCPGVYAIGDMRRHHFHQVATAVGDGAVAGMDALRYLKKSSA